jgi:hypothetical protein
LDPAAMPLQFPLLQQKDSNHPILFHQRG